MSQLFALGSQSIGASASAIVFPMTIQLDSFRTEGLIFLQSKRLSRVFSSTIEKHQFFSAQPSFQNNSHICTWLLEKPQLWLYRSLWEKWYPWYLITLSRFVIAFLSRNKHLLISWLQWQSAVILEHKNIKSVTASNLSPIYHEMLSLDAVILVFLCWVPSHSPLPPSSRLLPLNFLPLYWYHLHVQGCYFSQESWSNLWFFQPVFHNVLWM